MKQDYIKFTGSDHFGSAKAESAISIMLPKLRILKHDRDVLNWRTFWEQFRVSIHSRPQVSDAEKLAYLKIALKDGLEENVIQGL